jgi:PAS domain S-box-containing protein
MEFMYNEIVMDLSDRIEKLSEDLERLIEKAELWQLLFDESPDAIALFNANRRFFLVNNAFCELTGFSREEIINQKLAIVLPAEFRRAHKKYENDYIQHPEKKVNRHGLAPRILTREGTELNIDIDLSFFYYDNTIYYTAFIRKLD